MAHSNTKTYDIWTCCSFGDIQGVKRALTAPNVDVNEKSKQSHRMTPLHIAARAGYVDICQLLLKEKNIDPYAVDSTGILQPIHWAAEYGHIDVVKLFLDGESFKSLAEAEMKAVREYIKRNCDFRTGLGLLFCSDYSLLQKVIEHCIGGFDTDRPFNTAGKFEPALCSLTANKRFGFTTILRRIMQSMDKHLENPRELSSFVREAFETLPTSAAYAFVSSYADADNCDLLTSIALKRCNIIEKLLACLMVRMC